MSDEKRAFDSCAELKAMVGSQCLQYIAKVALVSELHELRERLREHEAAHRMESLCAACKVPVKEWVREHPALRWCSGCDGQITQCDRPSCHGRPDAHQCGICQRQYSCVAPGGGEDCVVWCRECDFAVCSKCRTGCWMAYCTSCPRCRPGPALPWRDERITNMRQCKACGTCIAQHNLKYAVLDECAECLRQQQLNIMRVFCRKRGCGVMVCEHRAGYDRARPFCPAHL